MQVLPSGPAQNCICFFSTWNLWRHAIDPFWRRCSTAPATTFDWSRNEYMALYVGALRYIRVAVLTSSPDQDSSPAQPGECDQARVQLSCLLLLPSFLTPLSSHSFGVYLLCASVAPLDVLYRCRTFLQYIMRTVGTNWEHQEKPTLVIRVIYWKFGWLSHYRGLPSSWDKLSHLSIIRIIGNKLSIYCHHMIKKLLWHYVNYQEITRPDKRTKNIK